MSGLTLVVTQTVAYYDRDEQTVEEILEAIETGDWETKHNEVKDERIQVYRHENGVDEGTLVYDSADLP